MDEKLRALAEAKGCKNPLGINLPEGRLPAPRNTRPPLPPGVGLSKEQLVERERKQHDAKLVSLYDYYATRDIPAERVAQHMGVYHQVEDGADDNGKVKYRRELDVATVRRELEWRRNSLRAGGNTAK